MRPDVSPARTAARSGPTNIQVENAIPTIWRPPSVPPPKGQLSPLKRHSFGTCTGREGSSGAQGEREAVGHRARGRQWSKAPAPVSVWAHAQQSTSCGSRRAAARVPGGRGVLKTASRSPASVFICTPDASPGVCACSSQCAADTALFTRCSTTEDSSSVTGEAGESCVGDAANSRCRCACRGVTLCSRSRQRQSNLRTPEGSTASDVRDWQASISRTRQAGQEPGYEFCLARLCRRAAEPRWPVKQPLAALGCRHSRSGARKVSGPINGRTLRMLRGAAEPALPDPTPIAPRQALARASMQSVRSGSGGRCVITCPLRSQASASRDARLSCRLTHLVTSPVARGRRHRPPHGDRGREAAGHERERGAPGTPAKERRGRSNRSRGAKRLFPLLIRHLLSLPISPSPARRGPTHTSCGPFSCGQEGLCLSRPLVLYWVRITEKELFFWDASFYCYFCHVGNLNKKMHWHAAIYLFGPAGRVQSRGCACGVWTRRDERTHPHRPRLVIYLHARVVFGLGWACVWRGAGGRGDDGGASWYALRNAEETSTDAVCSQDCQD